MTVYICLSISLIFNIFILWYLTTVLRKLLYVSENISDLYLLLKSFNVFVSSLYSMTSYNGEPIIQELMGRVREILIEVENFRDVFALTIDEELEEELDAAKEAQEENEKPLLHASS